MAKQTGGLPAADGEAEARGAPEHTLSAQDAQALQMLDNGHQEFISPYGDVWETGSVVALNDAEPWLFPPATAPTAEAYPTPWRQKTLNS